jgi:hypothetical protein
MTKICNICLEKVKRPASLDLNCSCKYHVHYTCITQWWKENNSCIICHENFPKPNKYIRGKRDITPVRKRKIIRRIQRRQLPRRTYPPDTRYIQDYMNRLPYDNENECKTIFVSFICAFIGYFVIRFIFYSNFYN